MILSFLCKAIWSSFCDTECNISLCERILWTGQPVWKLNRILHLNYLHKRVDGLSNHLHLINEAEIQTAK